MNALQRTSSKQLKHKLGAISLKTEKMFQETTSIPHLENTFPLLDRNQKGIIRYIPMILWRIAN